MKIRSKAKIPNETTRAAMQEAHAIRKAKKVADLPDFDAALYLDSEETIAAYLASILEANDPALLAAALGDIARARSAIELSSSAKK